ncbi:hypothetical protein EASAB2608_05339 [Streptomyces sp. EAS-AB2608]|nr:hypothetical protein EASAB2608_05339 [Streptomyces sp. EAS-AB2608]
MRAVPPSRSTTSASQWAGYWCRSCRSAEVCMGPRVRLASDNGARQSVEDENAGPRPRSDATPERDEGPLRARFTMWETGLDNPEH